LDQTERSKLLCRLDDGPAALPEHDRRRWKRWEYRVSDIAVIVSHPGGGAGRFLVCTRNLSNGGLSFIHGGYIHPGSECRVVLPRRDEPPLAVPGVVVHCRHLESSHHEIGVQFLEEVDATALLTSTGYAGLGGSTESVELPTLEGEALVVDQSTADQRLLTHHLSATGLGLMMVDTPGQALDAVRRQDFALVLCDLNLELDAVRMIEQMRGAGFKGPIVVITAEQRVERLVKARDAGANEIIGKPYNPAYLASLLAEWLEASPVERPIFSTEETKPGMGELIVDFIEGAQLNAQRLEKAVAEENTETARELLMGLMGSGSGYGFRALTEAARDALTALDTGNDLSAAASSIRRLISVCGRLRCATSVRPPGGDWGRTVA
jgi:CheY-like chemotaxis protein